MKTRKSFYDELELGVSASAEDIQAAYECLLRHLTAREHGLTEEKAARQINLLNHAYWTLSDPSRRAGYDAALASSDGDIRFAIEIREARWTPQKIMLIVIGSLIAISLAMQIVFTLYSYYRARQLMENPANFAVARSRSENAEEQAQAETRRRLAEESRLAAEERSRERERQEAERRQECELEENRRYAAQVSSDLRRAEEQAKREAESERRRAEQEERARQEAERRRIEQQKYLWQQQLRHY